jgi:membrane associated rhomboid family serine protease
VAWALAVTTLCVIVWVMRYADAGGTLERTPTVSDLLARGAALADFGDDLAAVTLHVTPVHILSNGLLMAIALAAWTRLGRGPRARAVLGAALAFLAGAAAFAAAHAVHGLPSCGASGMVYALVAMALAALWRGRRALPPRLATVGPLAVTGAALAALGASFAGSNVDALAHAFGFAFGGVLGATYDVLSGARYHGTGIQAR